MKPLYVVLLMGAAALGGGMLVRYSDHPVEITLAHSVPPDVVAPPVPPAHTAPSSSVPVPPVPKDAPLPSAAEAPARPNPAKTPSPARPVMSDKPSALSESVHVAKLDPRPAEPRYVARTRIPPEPPAVTPLELTTVAPPAPMTPVTPVPAPATAIAKAAPPAPKDPAAALPPEPNRATLKAGMLITVRINQALSSNLNSQGDVFSAILDKPLVADGFVIAERGAGVRGEVMESKSAGSAPELSVRLREVQSSDGQRIHIVTGLWRKQGAPQAPGGSVYDVALTRGGAAVIRPATRITFRLDETVEITEKR